ncbi:MAG TPA: pilus assembly protein PilM [Rhodocyclaceae bacterium]|nr:pilus assembly protein PilM [Rhodocyclaceae bacterium]
MQIDFSIFNPKARPLLGLDISSTSVKLVELVDNGKGTYRVERYAIEPLPRDAVSDGNIVNLDGVAETIRRAWKRMGTSTRHVAMALPTAAVISKKIILPANLREQDMELQVESEANQYIPFALEEVNLDFQVIGPAPNSPDDVEVMIAASRKEKIEDRVACAESADLHPVVMDVESFAIQSAFQEAVKQLPDHGRDAIVVLADIGANTARFTFTRNDETLYSREQAFGGGQLTRDIMRIYGMSAEEAEALKRAESTPDNYENELLQPFLDALSLEVSRALQFFYTSTPHTNVNYILLAGGASLISGIEAAVSSRTQIETFKANPFAGMATSAKLKPKRLLIDAPSLLVACGLALRRFDQ